MSNGVGRGFPRYYGTFLRESVVIEVGGAARRTNASDLAAGALNLPRLSALFADAP